MKVLNILLIVCLIAGCSSTPEHPKTVSFEEYQRDIEMYKRHIQQQDALMDKLSSRLSEMQNVIERNVRQQKNNECKVFCF